MPQSPIIASIGQADFKGKGSFVVGTTAAFYWTFTDINNQLYDPSDLTISIVDPTGTAVTTGTNSNDGSKFDRIELGTFVFTWTIPATAEIGKYTATLTYVVETTDGPITEILTEDFIVVEGGQGVITLREVSARGFLESLIGYIQRIPIRNEPVRFNRAGTTGELSFPRWNQTGRVKVFVNGDPKESGFTIDYLKGWIIFNNPISNYDQVDASYSFRWFTDNELDDFIEQGINRINLWAPHTTWTLGNIPDRYIITAEYGAAINVYRRWMSDVQFQEPIKLFGSLQRAQEVFSNFDTIKKNYEEEVKQMLEQKKYGPYVGLTKTISVPEFTLPGGRCMSYNTTVIYRIIPLLGNVLLGNSHNVYTNALKRDQIKSNTVYTNHHIDLETTDMTLENCIYNGTVKEIYEQYKLGSRIEVLSDNNGLLAFETVSRIWETGTKPLIRIEDEYDNFVDVSEEHIMFVNNKEVPARDVKVGDILTVNLFDGVRTSKVVNVSEIEETLTFDIEVPSTENLFVNNIKCHNSRWFRYLFKGA